MRRVTRGERNALANDLHYTYISYIYAVSRLATAISSHKKLANDKIYIYIYIYVCYPPDNCRINGSADGGDPRRADAATAALTATAILGISSLVGRCAYAPVGLTFRVMLTP